jgi:hypothetical protein
MATFEDVRNAVKHVQDCTGDPNAWQAGLSPAQKTIVEVPPARFLATSQQLDAMLATIRRHHPNLFDPATGAPVTPPPAGAQSGAAVQAMKNAEAALARVQSAVAEFDRQMIEAILHAHNTTTDGQQRLCELQQDLESAVTTFRLDTPIGAREFQRYLLGKLREILAVVQEANDDNTSKQALAAAWAALYASQADPAAQADPSDPGDRAPPPAGAEGTPTAVPDTETDPYVDAVPGAPAPGPLDAGAPTPGPPAPPTPAPPAVPLFGAPNGAAPLAGGVPGGLPLSGLLPDPARQRPPKDLDDALLGAEDLLPDDEAPPEQAVGDQADDQATPPEPAPAAGPTTVTLPDGETVTAANPQLAAVITAAAEGMPVADAFRQQGIAIPPPGTAVTDPIDPSRVVAGDVGMFSDRHALAVGPTKALLDGQIQHIPNVSGPSFLGWQHPPAPEPAPTATGPSAAEPTPTRPSATVAT